MNACQTYEPLIAEKLFGTLRAADAERLAMHLERCPACAEAVRTMEATLRITAARTRPEPTPAFWNEYYARLEDRLMAEKQTAEPQRGVWWRDQYQAVAARLSPRQGYRLAGAVAFLFVCLLLGWLVLRPAGPETPDVAEQPEPLTVPAEQDSVSTQQAPAPTPLQETPNVAEAPAVPQQRETPRPPNQQEAGQEPAPAPAVLQSDLPIALADAGSLDERTDRYLERSKVLLVGLVNMEADQANVAPVLARRQEMARELVQEADTLSSELTSTNQQRLGSLIDDLKIVLLQIANLDLKVSLQFGEQEANQDLAALELVKSGVERHGLLLKINLAEMR